MCQSAISRFHGQIPFGLRDGRIWAPLEVENGEACGCVCPACGGPLVAKHGHGRRRPHFSHRTATECSGNLESAIHRRAKQLICDNLSILLPTWTGLPGFPNPPIAQTVSGRRIAGDKIVWPAETVSLCGGQLEPDFGLFRPDVAARDDQGELLIEIRATHAVDDAKAALVRQGKHRMIEIDLSRMSSDSLFDPEGFKNQVLFSQTNRTWISHPAAERAWKLARDRVKALAAEESSEEGVPGSSSSQTKSQPDWGMQQPPRTFDPNELLPLSRAESEDRQRYPRIGTIVRYTGFGYGVVLSRATRARAVYRVQFGHGIKLIFFREDEPKRRF